MALTECWLCNGKSSRLEAHYRSGQATMLYFTASRIWIKVSFVLVRLRGGTWGNLCYFSLMEIEAASNPAVTWQLLIWFFGNLGSSCGHMIFLQKGASCILTRLKMPEYTKLPIHHVSDPVIASATHFLLIDIWIFEFQLLQLRFWMFVLLI